MSVMDSDGDGEVSLTEFRDLFIGIGGMDPLSVESLFYSIDSYYNPHYLDGRELYEF